MEDTCQTPVGPEFDNDHKKTVDDFINDNKNIFEPINSNETTEFETIDDIEKMNILIMMIK